MKQKKSALDVVFVSSNLLEYIEKLEIDKELLWTPGRPTKNDGLKYSDHYALHCVFNDLPMKTEEKFKKLNPTIWNTKRPGGWEQYKVKSNNIEEMVTLIRVSGDDVDKLDAAIEKKMNKLKYNCFGKVTVKGSSREEQEVKNLQKEKLKVASQSESAEEGKESQLMEIDSKLSQALNKLNNANFEKEINYLLDVKKKKGKAATVFKLREKVLGRK